LSAAQIRARLAVIQPFVRWVRTFSCTDGHEQIPAIAAENGLRSMVGVWLDDDRDRNEEELANAIEIAITGHADILAIGNEVLLRGEMDVDELTDYLKRAKAACPEVPVGYVDAYFQFVDNPRIVAACDILLANCYPFWEGCPAEHALLYMKEMYRRVQAVADGKPVVVSETGWPNIGSSTKGAKPSFENAVKYFVDTYRWAEEDAIDIFYFSAFDESWKTDKEGDVGAYWGLWDKDGKPKYC
jgi:exo-beta-1,3-glucanase (GH17 family)